MRVIVNRLVALGLKTGVGHYTAELVRCLPLEADGDRIDRFPGVWVSRAARAYARLRPSWQRAQDAPAPAKLGRWFRLDVHRRGLRLLGQHFRRCCARAGY